MGLKITSATDYAIRAMIHLACLPEGNLALREDIARSQKIPSSFMAKILRNLVRARLLRSSRGVNGGFTLARPGQEITMLDVVEAIEGPLSLTDCSATYDGCEFACDCPAAPIWTKIQDDLKRTLRATSLEDLVSTPRRHGKVSELPATVVHLPCAANAG